MVLSRRSHPTQLQITVASSIVTQVTSIKYLGVTVTSNLSWSAHIDNTCVKARKQLGRLYCHFHPAGRRALSRLYKSTVLPLLDYCACVWDPHQVAKIQKLEAVQRFAAKLATGLWSSGCQDPIQLMNWPPLATRQKRQKLLLCRRILLGGSIIPSSIFTPHPHHSPRLHHCMALHRPNTRTSAHLHSFFPSTGKLLNKLPSELISIRTQATFKSWLLISVLHVITYHLLCVHVPVALSFIFRRLSY